MSGMCFCPCTSVYNQVGTISVLLTGINVVVIVVAGVVVHVI